MIKRKSIDFDINALRVCIAFYANNGNIIINIKMYTANSMAFENMIGASCAGLIDGIY